MLGPAQFGPRSFTTETRLPARRGDPPTARRETQRSERADFSTSLSEVFSVSRFTIPEPVVFLRSSLPRPWGWSSAPLPASAVWGFVGWQARPLAGLSTVGIAPQRRKEAQRRSFGEGLAWAGCFTFRGVRFGCGFAALGLGGSLLLGSRRSLAWIPCRSHFRSSLRRCAAGAGQEVGA